MRQNYGTSDDMASIGRAIVEAITELRQAIVGALGVVAGVGAFVTTATTTQTIGDPRVQLGSCIVLIPTGAGSGALQAGAGMLVPITANFIPGVSFQVAPANGVAPGAGLNLRYVIYNPLV